MTSDRALPAVYAPIEDFRSHHSQRLKLLGSANAVYSRASEREPMTIVAQEKPILIAYGLVIALHREGSVIRAADLLLDAVTDALDAEDFGALDGLLSLVARDTALGRPELLDPQGRARTINVLALTSQAASHLPSRSLLAEAFSNLQ